MVDPTAGEHQKPGRTPVAGASPVLVTRRTMGIHWPTDAVTGAVAVAVSEAAEPYVPFAAADVATAGPKTAS